MGIRGKFEGVENSETISRLIKLTQSKNGSKRRLAASSLGKLSKFVPDIFEAVPYLIKLLGDEKPQVRQYSIIALGKIGDSRAILDIENLLNDGKYYVVDAAKYVLLKLSKSNTKIKETNFYEKPPEQTEISEPQKTEIFTVRGLTNYIKNILESDKKLNNLLIKGEISGPKQYPSGHTYFSLKDEESQINCILFKWDGGNINFNLEHGMKVIIEGNVEVYAPRGNYSIIVKNVQPDGLGSLNLAFIQLKEKLKQEGLFLDKYKKTLPRFPKTICIITSSAGAVLQDILSVIKRRYPLVKILVIPTMVQGKEATRSIVESIKLANKLPYVDSIILGRGGGSLEDLWCFNEEVVARAIFKSNIPIVSAVGHETDFTIADFVADYRAPTPSVAAEKVTPDIQELYEILQNARNRILQDIRYFIKSRKSNLNQILDRPFFKHPYDKVHTDYKELDYIFHRLQGAISNNITFKKNELEIIKSKNFVLDPKSILNRGYSIVMKDNKVIKDSSSLRVGNYINIILHKGELNAKIKK